MCGLAGFVGSRHLPDQPLSVLMSMGNALKHRGPDDNGEWFDPDENVGLAHRRLAIVDLTDGGHQPMLSAAGRYRIVFNGEIYNHLQLRAACTGYPWRGRSDTESLLASIERIGVAETLASAVGMFALALWDRQAKTLTLARDRLGEKPLYYAEFGGALLFGSELAALRQYPGFRPAVSNHALSWFLRRAHLPAPLSIYEGVRQLPPGHSITISLSADGDPALGAPRPYWSLAEVVEQGIAHPLEGNEAAQLRQLEQSLTDAVGAQMEADVPLGAMLSGGIDSSLVTALMQKLSACPVKTFTIGFNERQFDEAEHARAVAQHLGTDHHELYVQTSDLLELVDRLPEVYSEPFADSSQLPTLLVSQLARSEVTVALSGDGGDELFGGYNRYLRAQSLWGKAQRLPHFARALASRGMQAVSPRGWDRLYGTVEPILPDSLRVRMPGEKLHKLAHVLSCAEGTQFYERLISQWDNPAEALVSSSPEGEVPFQCRLTLEALGLQQWMMAQDTSGYLPNDLLVKVDRAAMGYSLETRLPFLDHRVVELAWRLPLDMKIRDGKGKWATRQILYRYVPEPLIERPKHGFAVPLADWLRGPLRDWAEALLSRERLEQEGYFSAPVIRRAWAELLQGSGLRQHQIWSVLMFQAWLEREKRSL